MLALPICYGATPSNSWEAVPGPAGSPQLTQIAFAPNGHMFVADRVNGFWKSVDGGTTWTLISTGLANTFGWTIAYDTAHGQLIGSTYGGPSSNQVYAFYTSANEGTTWTRLTLPYTSYGSVMVNTPAQVTNTGRMVFAVYNAPSPNPGLFLSDNGGTAVSSAPTTNPVETSPMSMVLNPFDNSVWVGTEISGAFISTNNGSTYQQSWPLINASTNGDIRNFAFTSANTAFAATNRGVWKGVKVGSTWTFTQVLPYSNTAQSKGLVADQNGFIYEGHHQDAKISSAVFRSIDGGATWQDFSSGIAAVTGGTGTAEIASFTINPVDGKLYAIAQNPAGNVGLIYRTVSGTGTSLPSAPTNLAAAIQ